MAGSCLGDLQPLDGISVRQIQHFHLVTLFWLISWRRCSGKSICWGRQSLCLRRLEKRAKQWHRRTQGRSRPVCSGAGPPLASVLSKRKWARLCLEPPRPWRWGKASKPFVLLKLSWLWVFGWVCFSRFGAPGAKCCGDFAEFYNRKRELRWLAQVQITEDNLADSRSFLSPFHLDLLLLTSNRNCFLGSLSSGKQNTRRRNEERSVNQRSFWQEI